jgi:hypothetical protein
MTPRESSRRRFLVGSRCRRRRWLIDGWIGHEIWEGWGDCEVDRRGAGNQHALIDEEIRGSLILSPVVLLYE